MRRFLACLLIAALTVLSWAGALAEQDNPGSVIVVMGQTSEPEAGFNPVYGWGSGEHTHEPLIQSTLTLTHGDLTIGYDLAEEVTASADGLKWTVRIREDVMFSDGEPLSARDVAFTYNTVKQDGTAIDFTMLDYAEALDDVTVRFVMHRAYSPWPYTMACIGILPQHAYGADYGENPIGSGRYTLAQWDKGQQVILEANPLYYGEAPKMRRVIVLFMAEDAAYLAARAGQADIVYTAASYAAQDIAGYSLLRCESVDNRGINLPAMPARDGTGNDVTADPAIRQAINLGIDRDSLIANVLNGYGTPAYSVADGLPWATESSAAAYDAGAAAALLQEAGWLAQSDGIREKDGLRATFTLLYPSSDSVRQSLAAEVSNQLRTLGIEVTTEGVGWDTAYTRAFIDPLIWGWGAHSPVETYHLHHTTSETGLAAYTPYANAEVDRLMDEALAEMDLDASYALWQQAQDIIAEDLPFVWLCNIEHLYFMRDGLQVAQQKIHPHGHGWSLVNNVDQWSWE